MQHFGNPRTYAFYAIVIFVTFIVVTYFTLTREPKIDYTGTYNVTTVFGNKYQISFNSVPSIINGLTSSTSVIVGFTGAIIGIFYKIFENNNTIKNTLLVFAFFEVIPLALLFVVYNFEVMGYIDFALNYGLLAFSLSLLLLIILILGSFSQLARKEKNPENKGDHEKTETQR